MPPPARHSFTLGTAIFLRALAIVHLVAFVSLWVQLPGLIGPHGILPAGEFLRRVHEQIGASAYAELPTLCWIFGTGTFLHILCAAGVILSLLLLAGIASAPCLALLWICYLSLSNAGQNFLSFQWDALLLEATFLAIFLAPWSLRPFWSRWRQGALTPLREPPRLARWLLRWLLFRLMFLSGVVKLSSGDPTWRDLTALSYHYETQPLPNPVAFYANALPLSVQRACCAGMFVIELFVPFFLFAPRPLRHNAVLLLVALQFAIALTGNFAFFNLLTIALGLLCFDDAFWRTATQPARRLAARLFRRPVAHTCHTLYDKLLTAPSPDSAGNCHTLYDNAWRLSYWQRTLSWAGAAFVVSYTSLLAIPSFAPARRWPDWFNPAVRAVGPFETLNSYGLFAVMTPTRPELIFEGSDDGRDWRAYELPYKPGDLSRAPPFVAPHQPRLDWQLWFAALGPPERNQWVYSVCEHLLRGTPEVLALFAKNPFPQKPPHSIRVVRYDYEFTTPAVHARTGRWWTRTPVDFYIEPLSLR
ncbi:MAG TPA: lipase maturation factor family protein [Opitutus sp.]|nr:lipase maturation factor family protein [Opitutus sp.]